MDEFEQYVISYTSEYGYGTKREMEKIYYYAYIIIYFDTKRICRFTELTKEEYEECKIKYPMDLEGKLGYDRITAQIFLGDYIFGHNVFFEGDYREDILDQNISELKLYKEGGVSTFKKGTPIMAWEKLCNKEYKSILILGAVSIIFMLVMIVLKIFMKESFVVDFIFLIALALVTAAWIGIIYMKYEKNKFLKMKDINLYTYEMLHACVKHRPGMMITKRFIFFSLKITKPIDLSDIKWVYSKRATFSNGNPAQIIMMMGNGKKMSFSEGISFGENEVYKLAKPYNPDLLIGYTSENKKRYKNMMISHK